MTKEKYAEIIDHCDTLTANGQNLSVSWDGGGDSGWFELKLDDEPKGELNDLEDLIVELVSDELGYGSFAGEFSTSGSVAYNRETRCFEGLDTYSESTGDSHLCTIEVRVPKDIWFDRINLFIQCEDCEVMQTSASFFVNNGPRIEAHAVAEEIIAAALGENVKIEISDMQDNVYVSQDITIRANEFEVKEDTLCFTITEFDYSYEDSHSKEITIHLTDSIDDHETI